MANKQMFKSLITDTWTDAIDGDPVGDIRWQGNKCYKCVKSSGALDFVAGDVVGYVAGTGYAAHTVSGTVSETDNQGAGVAQAAVTLTDVFFWIQIKGFAALNTTLTAATNEGDALTLLGADNLTLDLSAAIDDPRVATVIDDTNDEIICDFPF